MSRTQHLMQRGKRWYYNRAFPEDVQDKLGKAPFRVSLRTDSCAEAIRSRPEAERKFWAAVDGARAAQASRREDAPSEAEARSLAVEWFRREVAGLEEWLVITQANPAELEQALEQGPDELADLKRELVEEQGGPRATKLAREAAQAAGYDRPGQWLPRLVQRGRIAVAEVWQARLLGDYGTRPGDPLFAAAMRTLEATPRAESAEAPQRTLANLIDAFKAAKWTDLRPASQKAYEMAFAHLRASLGDAKPLAEIGREAARRVFELVKGRPRGYPAGKRWEGVSLADAVAIAEREKLPRLAPKSINDVYMGLASALFAWAQAEEWTESNPFKGLAVKDREAARDKRDAFTVEQLKVIFGAAPWTPRDAAPDGQPVRYWMPLLALYQGMRRGEIAQLRVASFRTVEGITVFDVRGELKNANARRTLPLHPELARLGFMAFVEEQREAGADYLFGEDRRPAGNWGDTPGDWFTRLVAKLGLKGKRLGLHSFRHNFEDALRRAGLHGTAIGSALAGRAGADPVAAAYGAGFGPKELAEAIGKVEYPGFSVLRSAS